MTPSEPTGKAGRSSTNRPASFPNKRTNQRWKLIAGNENSGGHKFSPERAEAILRDIREGATPEGAARKNGIHPDSLKNWVAKGLPDSESIYHQFSLDYQEAYGTPQVTAEKDIYDNDKKFWLERTRKKEWSQQTKQEITGAEGGPILIREPLPPEDV